jgi:hypothetical protein
VNSWIHPNRTEVLPTDVFVSRDIKGHGAVALKDTATNTFWAARLPKRANTRHITITYHFSSKFDLKNMAVWNGIGDSKVRDYNSTARVDHVFLSFPGSGVPGCALQFADTPGAASKMDVRKCNANAIAEVVIRIDDYYPSSGAQIVALAKVQFFKG